MSVTFLNDVSLGSDIELQLSNSSGGKIFANSKFYIQGDAIMFQNYAGTETFALFEGNGPVSLRHDNITRFATSSTGVSVTGDATISTIANATSDTDKFLVSDSGTIKYRTGAEVRSDIGAGTGDGTVTGTGANTRIAFWNGTSSLTSDAGLTYSSGNHLTTTAQVRTGDGTKGSPSYSFDGDRDTGMYLEGTNDLAFAAGGSTYLQVNSSGVGVSSDIYHIGDTDTLIGFGTNTINFETAGNIAFRIDSSSDTSFADNRKILMGDDANLEIYHNGTDSYIDDKGSGDLRIRSNFLKIEKYTGETMADFNDDNAVRLYYNNNQRWETLSDGAGTDGDIIETISNGGGKRIGFNVGDSFTHNSQTIAHYGISNADNTTSGGIVLSGYFGLKFATNGAIRAVIQNDGDSAHTLIAGFDENNANTSYYYIPFNAITEGASNQYYRTFACPQAGRVVSIMMMHTSGTAVSLNTYTTQLRVIKNGSTANTSGELTASDGNNDGSYIEYLPDTDFSKGDRLGFQFSKSNSTMRWRGTSVTIMIELDDYNL